MFERRLTDSLNISKANPPASPWSTLYREVMGVGVVSALPRCQVLLYTFYMCEYCHSLSIYPFYKWEHWGAQRQNKNKNKNTTSRWHSKQRSQDRRWSHLSNCTGRVLPVPQHKGPTEMLPPAIQAHPQGTAEPTRSSTARIRGRQQGFLSNYTTHLRTLLFDVWHYQQRSFTGV